jgi:hypothetical protein
MSLKTDEIDDTIAKLQLLVMPGLESFSLSLIEEAIRSLRAERSTLSPDERADQK